MAKIDWDPTENETSQGFEAIPKGRYLVRIEAEEMKTTKSGSGSYLEVELTIERGEYAKRKLWARINVHNASETAQRIGREQFNALCVSAGFKVGEVKDTAKLIGKRLVALVDIEKGDRGDMNRVVGFMAPTTAPAGAEEPAAAAADRPKRGPVPPNKPPAGKGAEDFDDDIPF
jgi:hypothetical protein